MDMSCIKDSRFDPSFVSVEAAVYSGNDQYEKDKDESIIVVDTLFNLEERNIMSSNKGRNQLMCCRTKEWK
jgi:hypothetical protein